MMIVLEHVADLDGRARDVVEAAAGNDVVLGAELDVEPAPPSRVNVHRSKRTTRRVADDVGRALDLLVVDGGHAGLMLVYFF